MYMYVHRWGFKNLEQHLFIITSATCSKHYVSSLTALNVNLIASISKSSTTIFSYIAYYLLSSAVLSFSCRHGANKLWLKQIMKSFSFLQRHMLHKSLHVVYHKNVRHGLIICISVFFPLCEQTIVYRKQLLNTILHIKIHVCRRYNMWKLTTFFH